MQQSMPIKVIFFDAVGTLFCVRGGVGQIYWDLAKDYGVQTTPAAIDQAFSEVFPSMPPLAFSGVPLEEIRLLEKLWWSKLVKAVFDRLGGLERFNSYFDSVFNFFSAGEAWEVYPETIQVLEKIKSCGTRMGIISNFDSRIFGVLDDLGLSKFFDSVHISSREGAAKPDGRIFKTALDHYQIRPDQAVHVGDNLKEDFGGAQFIGIFPIYLNRNFDIVPGNVVSISALDELQAIIKLR